MDKYFFCFEDTKKLDTESGQNKQQRRDKQTETMLRNTANLSLKLILHRSWISQVCNLALYYFSANRP
jgi:hypothetical protein